MKKVLASFGIAAVTAAAVATVPAYATAASLPVGDTYISLTCGGSAEPTSALNAIASDGSSTAIGSALNTGETCYADGSYNPIDGKFYAWDWDSNMFYAVDVETGDAYQVGNGFFSYESSSKSDINAIFADLDGSLYAVDWASPSVLYSIELSTSESDPSVLARIGELPSEISSMAVNPVTGKVYAQDPYGDLYEVSLDDASEIANYPTNCATGQWDSGTGDCWGVDFDRDGGLWYQADNGNGDGDAMLASATLPSADGGEITLVAQGVFTDEDGQGWYGESTGIIWGDAPEAPMESAAPTTPVSLATTGTESAVISSWLAVGLALIAGGLWLARRQAALR
ncbi:MAG TPA: hypothetical protein VK139_03000 [Microbacteriaceae bacterium]|nr:hypothetical protein [Microbacteriaceae bacterium]